MSAQLTKARTLLNQVGGQVRSKNLVSAANNLYEGVGIILKNPLMKAEREEFSHMIEQAVYFLSMAPEVKAGYAELNDYEPGKEKELQAVLRKMLNDLTANSTDAMRDLMADRDKKKHEILEKGQSYLNRGERELAQSTFVRLVNEFASDADLFGDVADRLIKAECYPEALSFLEEAISKEPKSASLYNRIGMVLRRMRDFPNAEQYYLRAMEVCDTDEYLLFNFGRLYVDWKKWNKVEEMASRALAINPDFSEAQKMLVFAQKKAGA